MSEVSGKRQVEENIEDDQSTESKKQKLDDDVATQINNVISEINSLNGTSTPNEEIKNEQGTEDDSKEKELGPSTCAEESELETEKPKELPESCVTDDPNKSSVEIDNRLSGPDCELNNSNLSEIADNDINVNKVVNETTAEASLTVQNKDIESKERTEDIPKVVFKLPFDGKQCLKEEEAGISEYISNLSGFRGIIKQRYSDFLVNEIDKNGEIVKLTSLDPPQEKVEQPEVHTVLKAEVIQQLEELNKIDPSNAEPVVIQVDDITKEERRKIHEAIRHLHPKLWSNTEENGNTKVIVVRQLDSEVEKRGNNRKRTVWPANRGNYTQFVLYKENTDTMDAVSIIANSLRMKPAVFTYAGVKDKRAKTSQLISVYRVAADRLSQLNKKLRNIVLGNFDYVDSPIKLGDLTGNHFKIVIRNVTGSEEDIVDAMTSLNTNGFINYFGMQRFGTTSVPTHHIGRALLLGKWDEAIELILKPRSGEDENMAECRRLWWETRDAKAAYQRIHRKNSIEGQLLYGLMNHGPNDLVNALNSIPRNTRLMYIHSYQSYIWNSAVSYRIKNHGLKIIDGDLIVKDVGSSESDDLIPINKATPVVYHSSKTDNASIYDVVMPLPGYDIKYPQNDLFQLYKDLLTKDGLDIDCMKQRVKTYSLSGSYRSVIVRPSDVFWSLVKYSDVAQPIVLSDLDVLQGKQEPPETDGSLTALLLELSLPSSSYATMALREILKMDTSASFQSTLNI